MEPHSRRYPGIRWQLIYGAYHGIEEFAVNEAQRLIQRYQPYVVAVREACAFEPTREEHLLLVGCPESHRWIDDLARNKLITMTRGLTVFISRP